MPRIFLTLAILSTLLIGAALALGLGIGDPTVRTAEVQQRVSYHLLTALAALVFASLVHALVLTYFMGTGRWMEETCQAYALPDDRRRENQSLKYRVLPALFFSFVLLVAAGALGAAADPASPVRISQWLGLSAAEWHFLLALTAVGVNLAVNLWEYAAVSRNARLIADVLAEVRRIRAERGLPV
jgi:hypothetical protein